MRKSRPWAAIAVAASMLVGIAGWAKSNDRVPEAHAFAEIEAAQLDAFQMMLNAKNLPIQEFEDLSLVFLPPFTDGRTARNEIAAHH
jgi:hypothetical protein